MMNTRKMMAAFAAGVLCIALSLSMAACTGNKQENTPTGQVETGGNVQIPNPFSDCQSMEEAAKLAGFDMTVPAKIEGYERYLIQAEKDTMIQVFYQSGDKEILIRKGVGMEDISGDYNSYAKQDSFMNGDVEVTVKGDDGAWKLAVWNDGTYAYSVSVSAGTDMESMTALVAAVGGTDMAIGGDPATWGPSED